MARINVWFNARVMTVFHKSADARSASAASATTSSSASSTRSGHAGNKDMLPASQRYKISAPIYSTFEHCAGHSDVDYNCLREL